MTIRQSMIRETPGSYHIELSGQRYGVEKELRRVHTGRSSAGMQVTVWKAFKGDEMIDEFPLYCDAKNAVFTDAGGRAGTDATE